MNYSTLEPLSFSTPLKNSGGDQEWQGQRSCRFGRSIHFQPRRDLIKTNFDLPDQSPKRGRFHFYEPNSFEKPFRSSIHKVPPIDHWHLRESKIRTMKFEPSEPHRRAERFHNNEIRHNPEQQHNESIRTFYRSNQKSQREYHVEQRMQRKVRIDPVQLRKTFYKDVNIFGQA